MSAVFMDTVGLLALWDADDQWHSAADRAMVELMRQKCPTVTTTLVLLECGNAASRRPYRPDVDVYRRRLASRQELVIATDDEWESAWQAYARGAPGDAGIVDQVSFIVMRRLGIDTAFTNDHHFRAAGFQVLF